MRVTNNMSLGSPLPLPLTVVAINCVETLKALSFSLVILCVLSELLTDRDDPSQSPLVRSVSQSNRNSDKERQALLNDGEELGCLSSWMLRLLGAFRLSESLALLLHGARFRQKFTLTCV
jgi:hypothetical protein